MKEIVVCVMVGVWGGEGRDVCMGARGGGGGHLTYKIYIITTEYYMFIYIEKNDMKLLVVS